MCGCVTCKPNTQQQIHSGLLLPLPSLVPLLRCLLATLKINISDWNPGTHVGSSAATDTDAWVKKNSIQSIIIQMLGRKWIFAFHMSDNSTQTGSLLMPCSAKRGNNNKNIPIQPNKAELKMTKISTSGQILTVFVRLWFNSSSKVVASLSDSQEKQAFIY